MPKQKLKRFSEVNTFKNCVFLSYPTAKENMFPLKGRWNSDFFKNKNPIVLELACGKGEFTVGLAKKFPSTNFVGIDLKGNRMWKGARASIDENINNTGFLRTRIDFIESAFAENEVSEIWITFPDPQPKKEKKRLTSPTFLARYRNVLSPDGIIHLKTDSEEFYDYTLKIFSENKLHHIDSTNDLYHESETSERRADVTSIKTYYENIFLKKGKKICYLKFSLNTI